MAGKRRKPREVPGYIEPWKTMAWITDAPRRCDSGKCFSDNGECIACLAANGETCRSPAVSPASKPERTIADEKGQPHD